MKTAWRTDDNNPTRGATQDFRIQLISYVFVDLLIEREFSNELNRRYLGRLEN